MPIPLNNVPHILGGADGANGPHGQAQVVNNATNMVSLDCEPFLTPESSSYDGESEEDSDGEDWSNDVTYVIRTPSPKPAPVPRQLETNNMAIRKNFAEDKPNPNQGSPNGGQEFVGQPQPSKAAANSDPGPSKAAAVKHDASEPALLVKKVGMNVEGASAKPGEPMATKSKSDSAEAMDVDSVSPGQPELNGLARFVDEPPYLLRSWRTAGCRIPDKKTTPTGTIECARPRKLNVFQPEDVDDYVIEYASCSNLRKAAAEANDDMQAKPMEITEYFAEVSATLVRSQVNLSSFNNLRERIDALVDEAIAKSEVQRERNANK